MPCWFSTATLLFLQLLKVAAILYKGDFYHENFSKQYSGAIFRGNPCFEWHYSTVFIIGWQPFWTPPTMADTGTISHASISENFHSNVYLYQFWCFYQKVNDWFGMPLHYLYIDRMRESRYHSQLTCTSLLSLRWQQLALLPFGTQLPVCTAIPCVRLTVVWLAKHPGTQAVAVELKSLARSYTGSQH